MKLPFLTPTPATPSLPPVTSMTEVTDPHTQELYQQYYQIGRRMLDKDISLEHFASQLSQIHIQLEQLSDYDGLITQFFNHKGFDGATNKAIQIAKRLKIVGTLLAIDIDYLKRFNDTYGHPAGDKLIQLYASVIDEHTREADIKGRIGGDEFVVFLLGADNIGAAQVADRIRLHIIQKAKAAFPNLSWEQTASIGLSQLVENDTIQSLRQRADQALYQAKQTKNTTRVL